VYTLTAFVFLGFGPSSRRWVAGGLLVGYWLLLTLVPVPGGVAGDLSAAGNLGAWLDRLLLGGHLWTPTFDPEGLLSTLPAVATCLLGTMAGERLLAEELPGDRTTGIFLMGASLMMAGLVCLPHQQRALDQLVRPFHGRRRVPGACGVPLGH
jgi:predicted acyltransferase